MQEFQDKVAVVTGAASGIGRAIAERCVQEGMKVVLADVEKPALAQCAAEMEAAGADVTAVLTDVSRASDVEALAQKTLDTYGAVHLLCNNAGVFGETWIWKNTVADWEWMLGVNLWGVIHGTRIFVPIMLAQDVDCHVINTSSMGGLMPLVGYGIYSATKHAVVALSEVLHHELELLDAKVKVSVLCPGPVNTHIGNAGRNRPASLPRTRRDAGKGPLDNEIGQRLFQRLGQDTLQSSQVADIVFDAIGKERFYILTHPDYNRPVQLRLDDFLQGRNPRSAVVALGSSSQVGQQDGG